MQKIIARVVNVTVKNSNEFSVTLGPGPKLFWLKMTKPPKLGDLLCIENCRAYQINVNNLPVYVLEGGKVTVIPDQFSRRVISPEWYKLVAKVVRRELFPFQLEGAAWLAARLFQRQNSLLGDEPGLGKTIQVLAAIVATSQLPAIVVTPASVKQSWLTELPALKYDLTVEIVEGYRSAISPAHIVLMSYNLLRSRERQLGKIGAKLIVFDEAHLLKEPQAGKNHRASIATRLAHRVGRAVLMTGTPILNRLPELWRLLHIMEPAVWDNFSRFREHYCTAPNSSDKSTSVVIAHGKAKNIEEIQVRTAPLMLRRLRKDVLLELLPDKRYTRLMVDLEPIDRQNYEDAEKDIVNWLRRVASDRKAMQAAKGQAIVRLGMLRRIAAVGKMRKAFGQYIRHWFANQARPLVIFAYHKAVFRAAEQFFTLNKTPYISLKGSDAFAQREKAVQDFQAGKSSVFLAPLLAAGVGINLQRGSDMLFLERLWTPSLMEQAESRCHRLGQRRIVTVTYMDAQQTIDEHIANVLEAKQKMITKIVDQNDMFKQEVNVQTLNEVLLRFAKHHQIDLPDHFHDNRHTLPERRLTAN